MNDNYGFKVFREPLGNYAYIPDCQLQFIEMKIDYLNHRLLSLLKEKQYSQTEILLLLA